MQILGAGFRLEDLTIKFFVGADNATTNATQFEGRAVIRGAQNEHEMEEACDRLIAYVKQHKTLPDFHVDYKTWEVA